LARPTEALPASTRARLDAVSRRVAQAAVLVGPTAIAFDAGGYFDGARAVGAVVAWSLVALAALTWSRPPLPAGWPGIAAVGGLAGLTAWVAVAADWAPLGGAAQDDLIRDLLYLPALLLAATAWRAREELRAVEPVLAAGTLVVIGYGLLGRLVPDLVEQTPSLGAGGRLEQPLTYWNAMGALAALGAVLCARLSGDPERRPALRAAAAGATAPLGLGIYLSFSRGALAAAAVGVVLLAVLAPTRAQLGALAIALGAGLLAALAAAPFAAVESLAGSAETRRAEGLAVTGLLALIVTAAALAQGRANRSTREAEPVDWIARRRALVGAAAIALAIGLSLVAAAIDRQPAPPERATATRLGDVSSNRYRYWDVALDAAASEPLRGVGPGGFAAEWAREREIDESAKDAHSLYLETLGELGLVGLLLLGAMFAGVGVAATQALRADPVLATGPAAVAAAWAAHAGLDWDWEMPALALVAIALAGTLLGAAELSRRRAD
jgi:hypothetical protein